MPRAVARALLPVLIAVALIVVPGASRRVRAQETAERLILTPSAGSTFRIQAVYPNENVTCEAKRKKDLRSRYRGKLEIVRQSDGRVALIDHLTFDEYLRGLAEVPRSWPMETLKAQVIAARSYALYHLDHPRASAAQLGYDICSTDQCQVYGGLRIEQGAFGDAWIKAVTETRGRVLLYRNEPIQAFYHSTSPGRTRRAFPGGSPQPYLSSVDGQDDDSPMARWTVRVPLSDLGAILRAAKDWPGGTITSVRLSGSEVRVSGSGRSVTLSKTSFRFDLNDQAACVFPEKYPTKNAAGTAKLPQTVPSIDFSLATSGGNAVLTGRGWGHAVGMSQYGAKHLAEGGRKAADILAYFYAGIRPRVVKEPGLIRVLVAEDATLVRIGVEGSATVTTATGSTLAPGDRFEVRGGDVLDIRRGVGPSSTPILTATIDTPGPLTVPVAAPVALAYTLSGTAKVTMSVAREGEEILRTPEISQIAGPNQITLLRAGASVSPRPSSASPLPPEGPVAPSASASPGPVSFVAPDFEPGIYEITLEAYDGIDRIRTAPVALTVQAPTTSPIARRPEIAGSSNRWIYIAAAVVAVMAIAGTLVVRRRRSG